MSHKFAKTDKPKINFYYKDMINDFKKQTHILKLQNNSKTITITITYPKTITYFIIFCTM